MITTEEESPEKCVLLRNDFPYHRLNGPDQQMTTNSSQTWSKTIWQEKALGKAWKMQ